MVTTRFRTLVLSLTLVALSALAPHALAGDDLASVEGQVNLNGKPLSGGRIFFHLGDGAFFGAKIDKHGKFKMNQVPVGRRPVTVESEGVPARFTSEEATALQAELKNGQNIFNFELSSK